MTRVSHSISGNNAYFEELISSNHFGTTFENRGQSVSPGSPAADVITNLPVNLLRYPGGTHTESHFDLRNPENPRPTDFMDGSTASFEPLSRFLSFVEQNDIRPVIVIPTYRYFDKDAGAAEYLTAEARTEITTFIRDVLSGKYGNVDISAFEVGNEWFNSLYLYHPQNNPDGWTPAEFGQLQGAIARIINEAIESANPSSVPHIWVQSSQNGITDFDRNGVRDNIEILRGFDRETLAAIDGVVEHFYQPTYERTPIEVMEAGWVTSTRIPQLARDGWNVTGRDALDIIVSEWNVRAARNGSLTGDDANITGFERMPLLLGMFADMVRWGVDYAMIFTAQALGRDGAYGMLSLLGERSLTPTGLLFDMMGRALPGTRLVDPNRDGSLTTNEFILRNNVGQGVAVTYTFESEDSTVIYFASGVGETIEFSVDGFQRFDLNDYNFAFQVLSVEDGGNPLSATVRGQIRTLTLAELDGAIRGDGTLQFRLAPYEVIQMVFSRRDIPLRGAASDDVLRGSEGSDTIVGGGGNDSLDGSAGDDELFGETGNDTLTGGIGDDFLNGGVGADVLDGGIGLRDRVSYSDAPSAVRVDLLLTGSNTGHAVGDVFIGIEDVQGSAFNDTLKGDNASNIISGLVGNDLIDGRSGDDTLCGDAGDDTLYGMMGNDQIFGADGNDNIDGQMGNDLLFGGDGNDSIVEWVGRNQLFGGDGNDFLFGGIEFDSLDGGNGHDLLDGNAGDDIVRGGVGSDTLWGNVGNDQLFGGSSNDFIEGHDGFDIIYGGSGHDSIRGGNGNDRISGSSGNDTLFGGEGNDRLDGSPGNDFIWGGNGSDQLLGGQGTDRLYGDGGNDTLWGFDGSDLLYGRTGDDRLVGHVGNDTLFGGEGADTFVFSPTGSTQRDVIQDFEQGIDRIEFPRSIGSFTTLGIRSVSGGVEVLTGNQIVFFAGHSVASIDSSDFIFI